VNELLKERQQKIDEKAKQEEEKQKKKDLELKLKSTPAQAYFKEFESEKYTQFDENGLPTHMKVEKKEGVVEVEINKEIKNKLQKEWNKQDQKYKKWVEEQQKKGEPEDRKEEDNK